MGGSAQTPALTALLCLGLCLDLWAKTEAGTLPKPLIWADPGPMVAAGSPVTIWCQGSRQADTYRLFKPGASPENDMWASRDSRDKASFPLGTAHSQTAGLYRCAYLISRSWSKQSDPLQLVVTGLYAAPSLSALPSPLVALGGKVSLLCSSRYTSGMSYLLKEGGAGPPQPMAQPMRYSQERWHSLFSLDPVNHAHGGTYRCYGSSSLSGFLWSQPSDPLELQVTGVDREPSLTAQPSSLVLSGDTVTLQCHSGSSFDRFALVKDSELTVPQRLAWQPSPVFPLGPVLASHGGRYRCYGGHSLSSTWSAPSAPLDILVAGMFQKPSLWAQPGPSVAWGENVTLQCLSESGLDTFLLFKEGSAAPPQRCHLQDRAVPSLASFTLSSVTLVHGGTYRCYGSHSTSPYLLSQPSEPLQLLVSGGPEDQPTPGGQEDQPHTPTDPGPQSGLGRHSQVLVGISVAFILLLVLLFFLLLLRHCRQSQRRKAEATEAQLKDRGLHKSSGGAAEVQEENLYAAVKDTQLEDRQLDRQATASEAPQDVTYAQLCSSSLWQTSAAKSGPAPDEASVYAALALH